MSDDLDEGLRWILFDPRVTSRLVNTQGKKVKRKAREKCQLEEARRFGSSAEKARVESCWHHVRLFFFQQ